MHDFFFHITTVRIRIRISIQIHSFLDLSRFEHNQLLLQFDDSTLFWGICVVAWLADFSELHGCVERVSEISPLTF